MTVNNNHRRNYVTITFVLILFLLSLIVLLNRSNTNASGDDTNWGFLDVAVPTAKLSTQYATLVSVTLKNGNFSVNGIIYNWDKPYISDCFPHKFANFKQQSTNWNFVNTDNSTDLYKHLNIIFEKLRHSTPAFVTRPRIFFYYVDVVNNFNSSGQFQLSVVRTSLLDLGFEVVGVNRISPSEKALYFNLALQTLFYFDKTIKIEGESFHKRWQELFSPHSISIKKPLYPISLLEIGNEATYFTSPRLSNSSEHTIRTFGSIISTPFFTHITPNEFYFSEIPVGIITARNIYLRKLVAENKSDFSGEIHDPCLHVGASLTESVNGVVYRFSGKGSYETCKDQINSHVLNNCIGQMCMNFHRHFVDNPHKVISFQYLTKLSKYLNTKSHMEYGKIADVLEEFFRNHWDTVVYMHADVPEDELKKIGFELMFMSNIIALGSSSLLYFSESFGGYTEIWEFGAILYQLKHLCLSLDI